MKCSLGISNFLEEISSLSYSIIFLYFFALITEAGFLISPAILRNSNNSRKTEEMEPKQKQHPVVDVTGDRSKI